jgi:hypothetical protein
MHTRHVFAFAWTAIVAVASAAIAQVPIATTATDTPGITITSSSTSFGTITDEQRARLAEKLGLVDRIMAGVTAAGDADQLQWLRERLYGASLAQLQAMGTPSTFQAASAALTRTAATPKDLGDPLTDLVYRPITPCRYIDTRNVGGPIVGTRDFDLTSTGSTYGGSGACDPKATAPFASPNFIAAININVTIVGPGTAPGFIGARPQGSANTTSLVNWYEGGPNVQAANAGVVSTGGGQLEFFGSPANIVVDVLGIFTMPAFAPPKIVQTLSYIAFPGGAGLNFPIAPDRPSQVFSTVQTNGDRGVAQVTIFQCCGSTPTFLEWVGLHSAGVAAIASGFSSTLGDPILKLDFDGLMLLEVNDATSMRLHNTSGITQTGTLSIVQY